MATVFISYRRDDTRADAGRLYDRLSARFGEDRVFMDIEDIAPGEDFVRALDRTLASCDVLLALIGRDWNRSAAGAAGEPDFVHLEIRRALDRDIRVIPVLVGNAPMPAGNDLPESVAGLAVRQAFAIGDVRFHEDVDRLIAALEEQDDDGSAKGTPRRRWVPVVTAIAAVLLAAWAWWAFSGARTVSLRDAAATRSADQVKVMLVEKGLYEARWNPTGSGIANRYDARELAGETVVFDAATGLVWSRGSPSRMIHAKVLEYVRDLNDARFAGFDDWRLPTVEEVASLLDPAPEGRRHTEPILDESSSPVIWTADEGAPGRHWVVYFSDATLAQERPAFNAWVKVVRRQD